MQFQLGAHTRLHKETVASTRPPHHCLLHHVHDDDGALALTIDKRQSPAGAMNDKNSDCLAAGTIANFLLLQTLCHLSETVARVRSVRDLLFMLYLCPRWEDVLCLFSCKRRSSITSTYTHTPAMQVQVNTNQMQPLHVPFPGGVWRHWTASTTQGCGEGAGTYSSVNELTSG